MLRSLSERTVPIEEWYLLVLSSLPIDLRHLTDLADHEIAVIRETLPPTRAVNIRYGIIHIPFTVHPLAVEHDSPYGTQPAGAQYGKILGNNVQSARDEQEQHPVLATDLPEPDAVIKQNDLPTHPPTVAPKARRCLGSTASAFY